MNKKVILHIPHSSSIIPSYEGYKVSQEILEEEILKLTDWHTEDLFYAEHEDSIVANFSRIFCDAERFSKDEQEVMAQFGMGVLYEKTDNGDELREVTPEQRVSILDNYYWQHHDRLNHVVNQHLENYGKALIIDGHSFPNQPFKRDLDQNPNRPDFNIGTDAFHTPQQLIDVSKAFFENSGYSLGIDQPYSGSLVPLEHYGKTKKVQSIMLEINRDLYLKASTNEKSDTYDEVKQLVKSYISTIKDTF